MIALVLILVLGGGGVAAMMLLEVGPFEVTANSSSSMAQRTARKPKAQRTQKKAVVPAKAKANSEGKKTGMAALAKSTDSKTPTVDIAFISTTGVIMAEIVGY
jgi:hypothetical protein